ncbi:MAG: endonuclease V [Candidatus Bathyarchaeota archaeon]|nr:endonuclease V [Candidatus Bathyarchaeota archaeon]
MELPIKLYPKFSSKKAHEMQKQLSKKLVFEDILPQKISYVAGVDVGYVQDISVAAVAVLDYNTLSVVESQVFYTKTRFPYVPTFLSFREIPPAYSVIQKLEQQPMSFWLMDKVLLILMVWGLRRIWV